MEIETLKEWIEHFNIIGYKNAKNEEILILQYYGLGKGKDKAIEYFIKELIYHIFSDNFKGFIKK